MEGALLLLFVVARVGKIESKSEETIGAEANVDLMEKGKAAQQERSADEENQSERDFGHHENAANAEARSSTRGGARILAKMSVAARKSSATRGMAA